MRSDFTGIQAGITCVYLGLVGVNEDAGAAGGYPDPASDFDNDWVFQLSMGLVHDTDKSVAGTFRVHPFDIKSSRRMARSSDLTLIFENQSGEGVAVDVHGRVLVEWP